MKRLVLICGSCLMAVSSANAAGDTPADVMSAEMAHEQQVQTQLEQLQRDRDAAFMKQLEAEALIMEQQQLANPTPPPANPAP